MLASYLLAALAIALAWPVPLWLSRATFTSRSPFATLILWQAIALAGGLSIIGAMLVWGLEPLGDNLLQGLGGLVQIFTGDLSTDHLGIVHVFALSAAFLLGVHLVFTLLLTTVRVHAHRRRHRRLLHLLSSPAAVDPRTVVVQHEGPVAYCLPGVTSSLTVVSQGLLDALDRDGLEAVLAHERSHLDQRHDLLVLAFESWHQALPWLPTSKLARAAVHELIEMLADDVALRQSSREALLRALVTAATGQAPAPGSASGLPEEDLSAQRLKRLITPEAPLSRWAWLTVVTVSVLLVVAPTVLLVAPALLY
nr:M56 family metallopeptidase [Zhihengliuella flava]